MNICNKISHVLFITRNICTTIFSQPQHMCHPEILDCSPELHNLQNNSRGRHQFSGNTLYCAGCVIDYVNFHSHVFNSIVPTPYIGNMREAAISPSFIPVLIWIQGGVMPYGWDPMSNITNFSQTCWQPCIWHLPQTKNIFPLYVYILSGGQVLHFQGHRSWSYCLLRPHWPVTQSIAIPSPVSKHQAL